MLLAFLAFVVLLAGFIAYAADNIARRAGRRHLRLFGLRPKTTALIVAVAAGMGISLASMLAFFALNRQAIRNIEQADLLRLELNGLKRDVLAVQSDLKNARSERDTANLRADEARQASVSATGHLRQAQVALKSARETTDQLKTQAQTLQTRISNLNTLKATLEAQAMSNRRALALSQTGLSAAQKELKLASSRASGLDSRLLAVQQQISLLDSQNAQAQVRARRAQAQAQQAQAQARQAKTQAQQFQTRAAQFETQATQAQGQASGLRAQIGQLDASRQAVADQRDALAVQRDRAAAQLNQVQAQFAQAQTEASQAAIQASQATAQASQATAQARQATAQASQATAQATQARAQLSSLTAQRDAVRSDLSALKATVAGLQGQALALKNDNDTLRLSLISSQADVKHLEDEYSRATTELSASRNTELSYSKNSIVYGGVVASVRSLDGFLQAASTAAASRGARGSPSVRLAPASRQALETTLRGLNASTFVLCRASGNAAAGFAVDLSCDARPNTLIYTHGSVIRRATITLQGNDELLRGQLQDLIGDAVLELTRRGVPLENVLNGGLNTASLYGLLTRLAARGGSSAVVGVMPRGDVKPSSQVDLYADIVP